MYSLQTQLQSLYVNMVRYNIKTIFEIFFDSFFLKSTYEDGDINIYKDKWSSVQFTWVVTKTWNQITMCNETTHRTFWHTTTPKMIQLNPT